MLFVDRTNEEQGPLDERRNGWFASIRRRWRPASGRAREGRQTQDELAERLGTTKTTVSLWESARQVPGGDKVYAIAVALGCTPNDLFGWGK